MRVLVACECSGIIRQAFRDKGHDAWSCDIKHAEDKSRFHLLGRVEAYIDQKWDLLIAHPPCTFLAAVGEHWMKRRPERLKERTLALNFFGRFYHAPVPRICIENPRSFVLPKYYGPPTQKIQPYWFGNPYRKETWLWLKNLPPLERRLYVLEDMGVGREAFLKTEFVDWAPHKGEDRQAYRSRTFKGIALAMADQWGKLD